MDFRERKLPTEIKNVGVDSRFRDTTKFPTPSEYIVYFENIFQNVVSVSLVFAVYEKVGTELYVNMYIDELSPNLVSNSNHIAGSFCQLPMTTALNVYDTSMYKCTKMFEKPLAKLSKLSIQFTNADGVVQPMREHFLKFEVITLKFIGREWVNNELFSNTISVMQLAGSGKQQVSDVAVSIKLPSNYDMQILITAFKSACDTLRSYNLQPQIFNQKYMQLKGEFKKLASQFQK
jgi:hypothetical protein